MNIYDYYEKEWNRKFEILKEYINSSEKVKEKFDKTGVIDNKAFVWVNDELVNIGFWFSTQRQLLMKKYNGMALEEIKKDETILKNDKEKICKLLELGVSYPKSRKEILDKKREKESKLWDEKFEVLKEYVKSSKKIKEIFEKTGEIPKDIFISKDGKQILIGDWLYRQRRDIMYKYFGMTIEQIKESEEISEEDKNKMIKLLELGVSYKKIRGRDIGQASFDSNTKQCDKMDNVIKKLKEKDKIKTNG